MTVTLLNPPESRKFHVFRIDELYWGDPNATGTLYRPKAGDMMIDWDEGVYRITSVDSNGIPTIEKKATFIESSSLDADSVSLVTAFTQYQPNITSALFFDNRTEPYFTCTLDQTFPILGLDSDNMIFYRGTDTSENGEIISMVFNGSGDLESNQIPLTPVDPTRPAVKRPVPFSTTKELKAGDLVTGVVYNNASGPVSKTFFVVEESAAIRSADLAGVFLEDIRIVSPLIDENDDTLIVNTLGTSFSTSLLEVELKYSNGVTSRVAIDGIKCKLSGWDRFDTSSLTAPMEVVLTYYADVNEPAINLGGGAMKQISKVYRITNRTSNDFFALKVFAIPFYQNLTDGWTIQYRLTNLDRDIDIDVTDEITVSNGAGGTFVGNNYDVKQELNLILDMDTVIPNTYDGYIHTQLMDITVNPPGGVAHPFVIDYLGDGINLYGANLYASANSTEIKVDSGFNTSTEWMSYLFNGVTVLYDTDLLNQPPRPTHFRLEYNGIASPEYTIAEYADRHPVIAGAGNYVNNRTVTIVWLLENGGDFDVMGHSPLTIKLDLL